MSLARKRFCFAVSALLAVLIGCSGYNSLPNTWTMDIPGTYEATRPPFKEIVEFRTDGTCLHQFFVNEHKVVSETGRWATTPGKFEISLLPDDVFSEFYDNGSRQFSTNKTSFSSYDFWPLPNGKTFSKISGFGDYAYSLTRTKKPVASTPSETEKGFKVRTNH